MIIQIHLALLEPLRAALVALDSHARASGTHDGYFWLLKRFGAYSAPACLDELALNRRGAAIFNTSVLNAEGQTYRAVLSAFENEVHEIALACRALYRPTSLSDGAWKRHFLAVLQRSSRSDTT